VVARVIKRLIDLKGTSVRVFPDALPSKPICVEADRTRLAQVFANLLNNSAKFTPRGGHVWLTVEQEGSDVVVKVRDNGVGIPAGMLPKIFEMFTQGDRSLVQSQGGLGIGQNLMRGLVEMHAGRVEVHSDGPGKGSEFVVRLPVLFSSDRGYSEDKDDWNRCSSAYRILVVDDNVDSADSLSMLLELMGHDTRTAYDGLAAVETATAFRPNVILLDIGLPKLNGYDACRRIRERQWNETVVIIALTGWGNDEDKCRSKEAGFNFHMLKPVDPAALEKLMTGLLTVPS
jgi:CheY-like chemotaxis protein